MINNTTAVITNSTVIDPTTATSIFFTYAIPEFFRRLIGFFTAPFIYPEMWWLLGHLVLTFVLFEFYFERHVDEDLGWSAALANSIVMIFISMELLRSMYESQGSPFRVFYLVSTEFISKGILTQKMIIVSLIIILGMLGVLTAVINYFHILPKKLALLFSGHKTVNILAYFLMVVVWRYTHDNPLPVDFLTVSAAIVFGAVIWLSIFFINHHRAKKQAHNNRKSFF